MFRSGGRYPAPSKAMLEIAMDHNLFQKVTKPTRENSILDLCFKNTPSFIEDIDVIGGISDHDIVVIEADVKPKLMRPAKRKIFLYRKANYEQISNDIIGLDKNLSPDFVNEHSVDEIWTDFKDILLASIDKHIPSKMSSSRFNLPWVNHSIKREIRKKKEK